MKTLVELNTNIRVTSTLQQLPRTTSTVVPFGLRVTNKSANIQPNGKKSVQTIQNVKMVKQIEERNMKMLSTNIGQTVKCVLQRAQYEKRLVVGLAASVKELSNNGDPMFCLMAPPEPGDSGSHMHSILLEAFCYENDIYIIRVDSSKKLNRILGSPTAAIESCVLIQKPWPEEEDDDIKQLTVDKQTTANIYTVAEEALVDHCEDFWDCVDQPRIVLPE